MKPFWLERNGFHVEKYFQRMANFWQHLEGAPKIPEMNLSGRIQLPEFKDRLIEAFGINPDAYSNW